MTDPVTATIAGLSLVVLGAVSYLSLPRPPTLDGERWFKVWLATLLRGQVEASGGDGHEWISLTTRLVPYHPAGRRPETKVLRPEDPPQSPALPGEVELHAALAALPTHAERWARLYDLIDDAEPGHRQDPNTLGDAYNPATWLGPDASWDA
ncbi:MAG: hypothetical protein AB8H79_14745, partial [Myxococcota bacterium]